MTRMHLRSFNRARWKVLARRFAVLTLLTWAVIGRAEEIAPPSNEDLWRRTTQVLQEEFSRPKPDALDDEHRARAAFDTWLRRKRDVALELLSERHKAAAEFLKEFIASDHVRLNHENYKQAEALIRLYQFDRKLGIEVVEALLKMDGITFKHKGAAAALGAMDQKQFRDRFARSLREPIEWHVVTAFYEVMRDGYPDTLAEFLPAMLTHSHELVRLEAALVYAERGDPRALEVLKASLEGERTNYLELFGDQRLATKALGDLYDKGGREVLIGRLDDQRQFSGLGSRFCDLAVWEILKRAHERKDIAIIMEFLQTEKYGYDPLEALLRIDTAEALPLIKKAFNDDKTEINVRVWAALQLGKRGDEKAIQHLEACCSKNLGIGDKPFLYLLQIRTKVALEASWRVIGSAGDPKETLSGNNVRLLMTYYFQVLSPTEINGVGRRILSMGSAEMKKAFWGALESYRGAIAELRETLQIGSRTENPDVAVLLLRQARIETDADRKIAAEMIDSLVAADGERAMQAVKVGHQRKFLSDEQCRTVVLRLLDKNREAVRLMGEVGLVEDLPLLEQSLNTTPVESAVAIRQIIRRAEKK